MPTRALAAALLLTLAVPCGEAAAQSADDAPFAATGAASDYARYEYVHSCVLASRRHARLAEFRERRDTLPWDDARPLPEPAVVAARDCGAYFPVDSVPVAHLSTYVELALAAGRDAAADSAVRRHLALLPRDSVSARARVLGAAIGHYIDAHPVRVAPAERLMLALDSLGEPAKLERYAAGERLYEHALASHDTTRIRKDGDRVLAIAGTLAHSARLHRDTIASIAAVVQGVAGLSIGERPIEEIARDSRTALARALEVPTSQLPPGLSIGRAAPPLRGEWWFRRARETSRPSPGRVSLLVFVNHPRSLVRAPENAIVRRLAERFGAELEITLVARTEGLFREELLADPGAEADSIRKRLFDELKLPGALVVSRVDMTKRPPPDRRVIDGRSPNFNAYMPFGEGRGDRWVLVDRNGKVAMSLSPDAAHEQVLAATIARLLEQSVSSTAGER